MRRLVQSALLVVVCVCFVAACGGGHKDEAAKDKFEPPKDGPKAIQKDNTPKAPEIAP
jgi:hypothetical protein